MESIIIIVHVIAAIGIIGLVLIQHGKGADMGASFGSGGSQTMFGSVGTGNVLSRTTTILAIVFFVTSLGLALSARQRADLSVQDNGLIENLDQVTADLSVQSDIPVLGNAGAEGDVPVLLNEPALGDIIEDPELLQAVEDALESIGN